MDEKGVLYCYESRMTLNDNRVAKNFSFRAVAIKKIIKRHRPNILDYHLAFVNMPFLFLGQRNPSL